MTPLSLFERVFLFVYVGLCLYVLVSWVKVKLNKPTKYIPPPIQQTEDFQVQTLQDIKNILADITFSPSCVDMGWKWECKAVDDGYLMRTSFRRPERTTGKIAEGFGRWWFISNGTTLSGVVKTAYKAALLILEHENMEGFKWRGKRIFNPHNSIIALAAISEQE